MTSDGQIDVAIVGAGISGLACAFTCRSLGMHVEVFDAAAEPGGCIRTVRSDGCIIEGGPQSFLSSPAIDDLIDALGLRNEVVASAPAARRRYVFTRRGLIAVPGSPQALIWTPLLSAGAKFRLICEPFVAARSSDDDESVASFVERRAGREMVRTVAEPFIAGIYGGDAHKISVRSAFPALQQMEREHGSIVRALRKIGTPKGRAASFSFAHGNGVLPQTLADALGQSVALRSPVDGIDIVPDGFEVQVGGDRHGVVKAKRIALAVATDAAARLLAPFAPDAARELTAIDHAPVVQCAFVYPRGSIGVPLDGFGFLATRDAGVRILGAVWNSVAFPSRSDDRDLLVTAFMGGAGDRALTAKPDDELAALAHADLRKAMKISETKPRLAGVFKWIPGIPQYNVGHEARLRSLEAAMARFPALALCGNFLRGVSVSDCVRQAREVALRLSGAGAGAR